MSSESPIQKIMENLLLHGDYSDMKVTCRGFIFNVHRAIVCTQSHFFASALNAGFKESITHVVDLPDDDPETIERVLSFMYLRKYNEVRHFIPMDDIAEPKKPEAEPSQSGINNSDPKNSDVEHKRATADITTRDIGNNIIKVYIAADKYGIAPLKSLAGKRFERWIKSNLHSEAFYDIVREVMTRIPQHDPHLRDVVADTISENIVSLAKEERIFRFLDTHGSLGSAVIAKLAKGRVMSVAAEVNSMPDLLTQKLDGRHSCRHCGLAMNVRIEKAECLYGIIRCGHHISYLRYTANMLDRPECLTRFENHAGNKGQGDEHVLLGLKAFKTQNRARICFQDLLRSISVFIAIQWLFIHNRT
ncbi:hypothetical protein DTO217A2_2331 [Paecilomyces variotii]|nr:hypothetical protein DTO217A2_2331 [Paecilomyces variotii]